MLLGPADKQEKRSEKEKAEAREAEKMVNMFLCYNPFMCISGVFGCA